MQGRVCGGGKWGFEPVSLRGRGHIGFWDSACVFRPQGMIALRRGATELTHEDYMEGILEVQAKKKANLQYYA